VRRDHRRTRHRRVAIVLMAATALAFALVALSVWGVPGPASAWPVLTVVAASTSALLLIAFWDRQLALGLAIDAVLVVVAMW
jgi:hypothetical protein